MGIVCAQHGYDHSLLGDKCDPNKVRHDRLAVTLQSNVVTVTLKRNAKPVTRNAVVTPAKPLEPMSSAARQKAYRDRKRRSV